MYMDNKKTPTEVWIHEGSVFPEEPLTIPAVKYVRSDIVESLKERIKSLEEDLGFAENQVELLMRHSSRKH